MPVNVAGKAHNESEPPMNENGNLINESGSPIIENGDRDNVEEKLGNESGGHGKESESRVPESGDLGNESGDLGIVAAHRLKESGERGGILTPGLVEEKMGSMSRRISIAEARNQLPELVDAAEHGQPIELTREGHPVAALVSLEAYRGSVSSPRNLWAAIQEFRQTHDLSDLEDIDEVYAGLRDPSPGRALAE